MRRRSMGRRSLCWSPRQGWLVPRRLPLHRRQGRLRMRDGALCLYTGPSGGLVFHVSNGAYSYTLSPDAGAAVWDGKWHLVVGTFDGTTVGLNVDGRQVGTGSPSTITVGYGLPDGTGSPLATTWARARAR